MVGLITILAISILSIILVYKWVDGIDHMNKNHPDYKGEDFLDWDNDDTKNIS
jgi:hypothetical protein